MQTLRAGSVPPRVHTQDRRPVWGYLHSLCCIGGVKGRLQGGTRGFTEHGVTVLGPRCEGGEQKVVCRLQPPEAVFRGLGA